MKKHLNVTHNYLAKFLYSLGLLTLFFTLFLTLFLAATHARAAEISVTPMLIELNQKPKSKADFSFTLRSTKKTNVKLRIFDMTQQPTGYMGFAEIPVTKSSQARSRIELDNTSLTVPKDQPVELKGQVSLSSQARGTQLFAVMVEEEKPEKSQGGITINVRYAVVIKVNVIGRRHRNLGKFGQLTLVKEKDGALVLAGMLTNNSPQDYEVKSYVQIRSLDNKLIETVELRSKAAWQKKEKRSRIFPGAKVRLLGSIRKISEPGIYKIRVLNRLGKRGQIVSRQEVRIEPGHLRSKLSSSSATARVQVIPSNIPALVRQNNSTFSIFTISNPGRQAVRVILPLQRAGAEKTDGKSFSFIPQQLQILPGRKKRVVLKQQFFGKPTTREQVFRGKVKTSNGAEQSLPIRIVLEEKQEKAGSLSRDGNHDNDQ